MRKRFYGRIASLIALFTVASAQHGWSDGVYFGDPSQRLNAYRAQSYAVYVQPSAELGCQFSTSTPGECTAALKADFSLHPSPQPPQGAARLPPPPASQPSIAEQINSAPVPPASLQPQITVATSPAHAPQNPPPIWDPFPPQAR